MSCKLPDEILLMIQDHLFSRRQPNLQLLLVSRHFYQLFLPHLYQDLDLQFASTEEKLIPFIRTVLQNPSIARSIQGLSLPRIDSRASNKTPEQDISDIRPLLSQASHAPEEQQEWESDLQLGTEDAWVALLFLKLPSLRNLSIELLNTPKHLDRIVTRAAQGGKPFDLFPSLQNLKDLHIGSQDTNYPYKVNDALSFFRLPAMRSFFGELAIDTWDNDGELTEDTSALSGISSVKSLKLRGCNGRFGMQGVITCCANLEYFEYHHQDVFYQDSYREDFFPGAFHAPLLMHKHSLTTLIFNDWYGKPPFAFRDGNSHNQLFGSLVEFTALKEVRIRLPNLIGDQWYDEMADLLPPTLENLHLANCWDRKLPRLIPELERVVADRERFSTLKELSVQPFFLDIIPSVGDESVPKRSYMTREDERKFDNLRDACERAGIVFSIHIPRFFRTIPQFLPWL